VEAPDDATGSRALDWWAVRPKVDPTRTVRRRRNDLLVQHRSTMKRIASGKCDACGTAPRTARVVTRRGPGQAAGVGQRWRGWYVGDGGKQHTKRFRIAAEAEGWVSTERGEVVTKSRPLLPTASERRHPLVRLRWRDVDRSFRDRRAWQTLHSLDQGMLPHVCSPTTPSAARPRPCSV